MPSVTAKRQCPDLIFVKPRFDVYKAISRQIRAIFAEHTPIIEPLSLDEAYLDVTENLKGIASATRNRGGDPREDPRRDRAHRFGRHLLQQVPRQARLRPSQAERSVRHHARNGAGIRRDAAGQEVPRHRSGDQPGRWTRSASTPGSISRDQTLDFLQQHFGKAGAYYYWISRGIDERPVRADRVRKSVGAENTFPADLFTYEAARDALREIAEQGLGAIARAPAFVAALSPSRSSSPTFRSITRSRTGQTQIRTRSELEELGNALLEPLFPVAKGIRLLGISLSSLAAEEAEQTRIQPARLKPHAPTW